MEVAWLERGTSYEVAKGEREEGTRSYAPLAGTIHSGYAPSVFAGIWNILIGLAAVAAGASGRFSLIGTNSSVLLMVFGGLLAAYGVYQIIRQRRAE